MSGGFVYVIKGPPGKVKVGQSQNPLQRISDLQTGCPYPLEFAYTAVAPGDSYASIEGAAHNLLDRHRAAGEWFNVPPETAVAALHGAAHNLGHPLQPIKPEWIEQILRIGAAEDAAEMQKSRGLFLRLPLIVKAIVVLIAVAAALIFGSFLWLVIGALNQ